MKRPSISIKIKGLGVCLSLIGFFLLGFGTKSVKRDVLDEAYLWVGGIAFLIGLLLLIIGYVVSGRQHQQQKMMARRGFEVLHKNGETQ